MKHQTLQFLSKNGINVPRFTVVRTGDAIDLTFSSADRFAVRSSFAMEDDTKTSFAGQFDTYLNVARADVAVAVQKVADSAHSKTVQAYQSARSVDAAGELYIIIQEMVDADLSGVIFTANPMGILNETVAVVGAGLGCNVVEDKTPTTSYFYNQDDGIYSFDQQEGAPLMDEETLISLIDTAKQMRELLHYEADIEYAIQNGEIFILQARPITTLCTDHPIILDNSNIVESYPGLSLPLTRDFVKDIYHGIFARLVLRITKNPTLVEQMEPYLRDMTDSANWRIYYRISNWYAVLKLLPCSGKIIPVWQRMMGVGNTAVAAPDDIIVPLSTKWTVLRSFVHYLLHAPRYMDALNESFAERFARYQQQAADCTTPEALLEVYEQIKAHILIDWDLTLVNDLYTFLYTALSGKKNGERIANVRNLESMKPVLAVNRLVECAKQYGIDSADYREAAADYIRLYGDRCLGELKLETETYRTHPEKLDEYVQSRLSQKEIPFCEPSHDADAKERKERNPFVRNAKLGIRNREISRLNRSRIFGLSREIFLKIGDALTKNGQIERPRDVFYLQMDELLQICDLREVVARRKEEERHFEQVPPYSRLVFADQILHRTAPISQGSVLHSPDLLCGTPSSVGKVIGEVLVVDTPDDRIQTAGKILVTRSTDPGWVFLIQGAVGIIAEKGSLLSHTAIISRELQKPAVVGVKDCTKLLKSGDRVELDAYAGTIKLLK